MIQLLDEVTKWLQEKVCNELEFKVPPENNKEGAGYKYKLSNPNAFACYCPTKDTTGRLPTAPSVTVQIDNYVDNLYDETEVSIGLVFIVWNTGTHIKDKNGVESFEKSLDGWRDLWRFMEKARNAIKKEFCVAEYAVTGDISGRPLHGDSAITGTYPYFFGEMTFNIQRITSYDRTRDVRNLL